MPLNRSTLLCCCKRNEFIASVEGVAYWHTYSQLQANQKVDNYCRAILYFGSSC